MNMICTSSGASPWRWSLHLMIVGSMLMSSVSVFVTSPAGESPSYCTVFHHMVKSGGSSIKHQLMSASSKEVQNKLGICVPGRGQVEICEEALRHSPVIAGLAEMIRQSLEDLGRECSYFTMMRHPVERVVSAFYYCPRDHDVQDRPREMCGDTDSDVPATERLIEFARRLWKNRVFIEMTYLLTCSPSMPYCHRSDKSDGGNSRRYLLEEFDDNGGISYAEAMEVAQRTLSTYTAVGIMDEWQLSMQLFNATVPTHVRQWDENFQANTGNVSDARQAVLDWAYLSPELHSTLAKDLLLYDYALSLFKIQTRNKLGTQWD